MSEHTTRIFMNIDPQRKPEQKYFPMTSEISTLGDIDEKEILTGDFIIPLDKNEEYLNISTIRAMNNEMNELTKQYNQLKNESNEKITRFTYEIKKLNEKIERLEEGMTSRFKIPESWFEE